MADNRKLFKEAIATFGVKSQIDKTVEECAELIVALQKYKQNRHVERLAVEVAEEVADVEIMCSQMRVLFQGVPTVKKYKIERLAGRIKNTHDMWDKGNSEES